jgi:hypothetical protein
VMATDCQKNFTFLHFLNQGAGRGLRW